MFRLSAISGADPLNPAVRRIRKDTNGSCYPWHSFRKIRLINNKGDNDEDANPDTEQEESDEGGKSGFDFGGCVEIFDDGAEP